MGAPGIIPGGTIAPGGGTPTMLGPAVIIRGMSAVRMKRERGRRLL